MADEENPLLPKNPPDEEFPEDPQSPISNYESVANDQLSKGPEDSNAGNDDGAGNGNGNDDEEANGNDDEEANGNNDEEANGNKATGPKGETGDGDEDDKGIKLTAKIANVLVSDIEMNMRMHNIASMYFAESQFYIFTFPQASLTALAGVLAFGASTPMLDAYKDQVTLLVGVLSSAVVLVQTMNGVKNYGIRADRHNGCAVQLRDLKADMHLIGMKLEEVERLAGLELEGDKSSAEAKKLDLLEKHSISFAQIQKRFKQCLSGCASTVPMPISEAFSGVDSNITILETKENVAYWDKLYPTDMDRRTAIKDKAYDILGGEIVSYWRFPSHLPNSKKMVNATMSKLRLRLLEASRFSDDTYIKGTTDKWTLPPFRSCYD